MKFVLFYHSLISDWNHGNAHFLRGVASELLSRGHRLEVHEPRNGWSLQNLTHEHGQAAIDGFHAAYPELATYFYDPASLDLDRILDDADVAIVHEWNEPDLVRRIGERAQHSACHLFFHDTHHRSISEPHAMRNLDLRHYDGVLAFGKTIADTYLERGWARLAWVWHEAADTRRFHPVAVDEREGDLVWIGNWGDDERSAELQRFLIDPVASLGLKAKVYGVRYPQSALQALRAAHIDYGGWVPNYRAPEIFARFGCTVHVPRRTYAETLIGVPTIRMFEALACGTPLISAPWLDSEHLFCPGSDYLVAQDGAQMRKMLREVLSDQELAKRLAARGLETIRNKHTCKHRVDELLHIVSALEEARHQMSGLKAAGAR